MKKALIISMVCVFSMGVFFDKGVMVKADERVISNKSNEQMLKSLNEIPDIAFDKYPDIRNFVLKAEEYINKNKNVDGIEEQLKSLPEYIELEKKYKDTDTEENNILDIEQEARINKKAKEIYDTYKKNGVTKEDVLNDTNLPKIRVKRDASAALAVDILSEIGYSISEAGVARICAGLGTLMGLDGPLPFGDFIALVTGGIIVSAIIINAVINYKPKVVSYVASNVGYNASLSAERAIESCKVYRNNNNSKYFYAKLGNQAGGGISLMYPVSEVAAVGILKMYHINENTFTYNSKDAEKIAQAASVISSPTSHWAHRKHGSMPLNLPHFHPTITLLKQDSHSFYIR